MRVIFMGTPDFSVPILDALVEGHEIAAVYSQPPRPAGRGKKERKSAVHEAAEAHGAFCGRACLGGAAAIRAWTGGILEEGDSADVLHRERAGKLEALVHSIQKGRSYAS